MEVGNASDCIQHPPRLSQSHVLATDLSSWDLLRVTRELAKGGKGGELPACRPKKEVLAKVRQTWQNGSDVWNENRWNGPKSITILANFEANFVYFAHPKHVGESKTLVVLLTLLNLLNFVDLVDLLDMVDMVDLVDSVVYASVYASHSVIGGLRILLILFHMNSPFTFPYTPLIQ